MKKNYVLPPLQHNGNIITDPTKKAEIFNEFFVRQTKLDERLTALPENHARVQSSLSHVYITEFDTYKILSNLNVSKATGPDGISCPYVGR